MAGSGIRRVKGVGKVQGALVGVSMLYLLVCIPYAVRVYAFIILALRPDGALGARAGADSGAALMGPRSVTVIIPGRNEAQVVVATVRAALAQVLPPFIGRYEVLVVNDGSTDETGAVLDRLAQEARGRLRVIHRQAPQGKASALNEGVRQARGDVLVFIDADHVLRPDAVARLAAPLISGAAQVVQGRCVVRNPHVNLLTRLVEIDNTVSYAVDLAARSALGTCPITGSTMAMTRTVWARVGGFCEDRPGEDTDMSLRIMRERLSVRYEPAAVSEDLAPATLRGYVRQRRRWASGQNTVLFFWMRSAALGDFWELRRARFEVLLYMFIYIVPVLGLVAALGVGLQVVFHLPVLMGPWHSTLALWLAAAYPVELVVAACIRHTYKDILFLPVYLVRGPVESVTAVLGLIDCLRHERTWYQTERAAVQELG